MKALEMSIPTLFLSHGHYNRITARLIRECEKLPTVTNFKLISKELKHEGQFGIAPPLGAQSRGSQGMTDVKNLKSDVWAMDNADLRRQMNTKALRAKHTYLLPRIWEWGQTGESEASSPDRYI